MIIDAKVPVIGESINEVTLSQWLVEEGDYVEMDQPICEFESDKATLEFPAEKAGTVTFVAEEGQDLAIGDVVAKIDTSAEAPVKTVAPVKTEVQAKETPAPKLSAPAAPTPIPIPHPVTSSSPSTSSNGYAAGHPSPAAAKMMAENGITSGITGTGKDGRITKADVLSAIANGLPANAAVEALRSFSRDTESKKMSRLRKTIARRLVAVKNDTAMLTTFNDVNLDAVISIRSKYKEKFREKHGVNLGFMSFFTRACCNALLEFPSVNAYLNEDQVILHNYCDISIAVSTPKGLVVPVIRNAESLAMHQIESTIKDLALRGRDGKLSMDEMEGGTFTITNGGVFGSMLSTPIINAPQSAILGMHKIEDRPIAVNGKVEVHKMMYLALSYDHRIIDGKESVSFLVRVKEQLENPEQLLFGTDPVKLLLNM